MCMEYLKVVLVKVEVLHPRVEFVHGNAGATGKLLLEVVCSLKRVALLLERCWERSRPS